jgi:hypothetical protein
MEMEKFLKEYLNKYILELFKSKKDRIKELETKKFEDFIFFEITYEQFNFKPKLLFFKTLKQNKKSNLCGFYAFFFAKNYLNYLEKNRNLYYLLKNTSNYHFFKFYNKILKNFLEKGNLDEYEKEELLKEGSIERNQIEKILNLNKEIYKNEINNIKINYNWIEYSFRNFNYYEIEQINVLKQSLEKVKNSKNEIHIFFIAMQVHWLLIIIDDNINKYNLLIFDSDENCDDYITLIDEKKLEEYINSHNLYNQNILHQKPFSNYHIKMFKEFVFDYQKLFQDFLKVIFNINLEEFIIEKRCFDVISSINNLSLNQINDKTQIILSLYNLLLSEYHPNVLKENFYFLMEKYKINKNCKNEIIHNFFTLINKYSEIIKDNLNLIKEKDIIDLLNKFIDFNKLIQNL